MRREPRRRCARAQRDETLVPQVERVWQANVRVYGADKVWRPLAPEGTAVARCTPEMGGLVNNRRLLEPIGYTPPSEAEAIYCRHLASQATTVAA